MESPMDDSSSFQKRLSYLEHLAPKHKSGRKRSEKRTDKTNRSLSINLPAPWKKTGEYIYVKTVTIDNPLTFTDFSFYPLIPAGTSPGDLLFFDLETTGLSGGAGNICFLLGLGQIKADGFEIRQVFLSDFPGEGEFLHYIAPFLCKEHLFVSYNGKSFDSHLLRTRFSMNRMKCEIEKQCDLLHISRRFFKNIIGSCSLGDIEEKVLSIHRKNDVTGFEVPDIYFDFLRTGEPGELIRVFEHNFQDILSLAHLFEYILTLMDPSASSITHYVDQSALGQFLLEYGDQRGILLLEQAFKKGDIRAGKYMSLYFKRNAMWEKALEIWEIMVCELKSTFAAIELAKYYEHRKKEYGQALVWVEKVFKFPLPLSMPERMELLKRKERLVLKKERLVR